MHHAVMSFRAVPEELVPQALRSWTPLPPAPAPRVDADRPTLRRRNPCQMMVVVDALATK